jgi:hypothetical protein
LHASSRNTLEDAKGGVRVSNKILRAWVLSQGEGISERALLLQSVHAACQHGDEVVHEELNAELGIGSLTFGNSHKHVQEGCSNGESCVRVWSFQAVACVAGHGGAKGCGKPFEVQGCARGMHVPGGKRFTGNVGDEAGVRDLATRLPLLGGSVASVEWFLTVFNLV